MKKRFLYFIPLLLLGSGIIVKAGGDTKQPSGKFVLQSQMNAPRPGDSMVREVVTCNDPGMEGENLTWDFRKVTVTGEKSPVNYYLDAENRLTGAENATNFRYRLSGDSLLLTGYENASLIVANQTPALVLKFPLQYGSQSASSFYGRGKYCDRMEYLFSGSTETTADGCGRLLLPNGDTLTNTLRVHIKIRQVEHYLPLEQDFDLHRAFSVEEIADTLWQSLEKTGHVETDIYRWYAQGSRYPVFETVDIRRINKQNVASGAGTEKRLTHTAYLFDPKTQRQQLPEDMANQSTPLRQAASGNEYPTGIDDLKTGQGVNVYPNPVVDNLNISIQLSQKQNVQLFLYDMQGRMVYKSQPQQREGSFIESVTMGHLAQGNYVLRVQAGDKSEKKVIVKQ